MESVRCPGCMQLKTQRPLCEHCGYNENIDNLPHQLPIGTRLQGRYEVGKVLGQGGFGITYIGWDHEREIPVAVKEFYPNGVVNRDAASTRTVTLSAMEGKEIFARNKARFLKEAHTLARLNNVAEIVHVYSLFEENNTAYIVMEYLKGVDLRKYIRMVGGKLSPELTFAILQPVMSALQKLHEEDMVHRDISPDNIMLMNDGTAKLLDFGSAREVLDADPEQFQNRSTEAVLKHGFAPMEQYQRNGTMGPWTDVYALSATIYYCLTGRIPPDAPNRIMDGEMIPWDQIAGLTPAQVQALNKAMELIPKDRTRSVRELAVALFGEEKKPEPKPEPKPKPAPARKKGRGGKILLGIAAAAAVAVGAMLLLKNSGPKINTNTPKELDMTVFAGEADREIGFKDGSRIEIYLDEADRENGRVLLNPEGEVLFRFTADYNENGDMLYQTTFDGNGQLLRTDSFAYNDQGEITSQALVLADGTVHESVTYEYNAAGDTQRTVTRNRKNKITDESVYTYGTDGALLSVRTEYSDGEVSESAYNAEGDLETITVWNKDGALERTIRYTEYKDLFINIRMYAPQAYDSFAALLARGGWPVVSASPDADSGSGAGPAPYAGSGEGPSGGNLGGISDATVTPFLWEIDNGGGGGGGSSKKPSGKINVAITEPEEEYTEPPTTVPEETTEPTETEAEETFDSSSGDSEAAVGVPSGGQTETKRVNTRREQFGPGGKLEYAYETEYDYRGLQVRERSYDAGGELSYSREYRYADYEEELIGVSYAYAGGYASSSQYMNDICGNTVRQYNESDTTNGYTEFTLERNISESVTYSADGIVQSTAVYSYDENGMFLGYTSYYISSYDGSTSESEYDADYNFVSGRKYNKDGTLVSVTKPEFDEQGNMIRENTYDVDGNLMYWYEYSYDENGSLLDVDYHYE